MYVFNFCGILHVKQDEDFGSDFPAKKAIKRAERKRA